MSGRKQAVAQAAAQHLEEARQAEAAARYAAAGEPVVIEESWYPILVGLYGDTPFAAKLRRSVGAAASTGCPNCLLLASKKAPNDDGTPSDQPLKATAYGGFYQNAQVQEPQITGTTLHSFTTRDEFSYQTDDNTFDRQAAEGACITDDLEELMAAAAESITTSQRAWFTRTLRAKLEALGTDATNSAKQKGMHRCMCNMHAHISPTCNLSWSILSSSLFRAVHLSVFNAFYNRCNKEHLDIGRTGRCIFSSLPYYRCAPIRLLTCWRLRD